MRSDQKDIFLGTPRQPIQSSGISSKAFSGLKEKACSRTDRRISGPRSGYICQIVEKKGKQQKNCQESTAQHYSLERRWLESKHPVTDHDGHDQPKENQQKRNNEKTL